MPRQFKPKRSDLERQPRDGLPALMMADHTRREKMKNIKKEIMRTYGIAGEDQHNKNLEIVADYYIECQPNYYRQSLEDFAGFASDEGNLKEFIRRGAVIL